MNRWDPFREFSRIEREIRRMFEDFWFRGREERRALAAPGRERLPVEREEVAVGVPAVDLIDKKDSLVVRAELPGVKKENLRVNATDEEISISGKVEREKEERMEDYYRCERTYGSWQRTIPLPVRVKSEQVKAKYVDGILEVTLPKTEEEKKRRKKIEIE